MSKAGAGKRSGGGFDKSILFEDHRAETKVDLPPYGVFSIRSLTREQAIGLGEMKGAAQIEQALVSFGVVSIDGEPVDLSMGDVRRWQAAAAGMALEPLSDAIAHLSGLDEEAERETVGRFPGEPGD